MGDNELGAFLRACREAVTPAEVGLPAGARRRTSGLRRAELATLAGISVDYLTRLEQGRDQHPSAQVLAALATALRLSAGERLQLLRLSGRATAGALLCPVAEPPAQSVRPTVQAMLDRLEPTPAFVTNRLGDLLTFTAGYARLAGPVGLLDAPRPNLLRFLFADPRARLAFPEWDRLADELVADLKFEHCPQRAELVDELTLAAGPAFTDRLSAPLTFPTRTGVERLTHPDAGELRLAYETLELSTDEQRLVVYLPADEPTSAALDTLQRPESGFRRTLYA